MAGPADDPSAIPGSLASFLDEEPLSEGQRRRLALLEFVESELSERIGKICVTTNVDVSDVAVLVVSHSARSVLLPPLDRSAPNAYPSAPAALLACHREELHAFLSAALPAAPEAGADPYADLLEAAPARCARVLVLDDESVTILSYGTFVIVRLDESGMPAA